ncbi:unnamed protein product [Lota lota]
MVLLKLQVSTNLKGSWTLAMTACLELGARTMLQWRSLLLALDTASALNLLKFIPGELRRIEGSMDDSGYESETQEKAPGEGAGVFASPPQPIAPVPSGSFGSDEHGRDDWQVNRYRRCDNPVEEEHKVQTFPSASEQSFLTPSVEAQGESQAAKL